MARRQRIDSAAGAVSVLAGAAREITLPAGVKLTAAQKPFWQVIVKARPRSDWNDADLITAAQLARTLAMIERCDIDDVKTMDKLTRLSLAMRRSLGLDVRGKDGRASNIATRREHAAEIEGGRNPMADDGDGLLARPAGSA